MVAILPQRGTSKRPTFAVANGEGTFRQDGLPPGEYLVFAADNAMRIEYDNPEAVQSYLSQASHVTLSPGQVGKVSLTAIKTGDSSL
jgi:hypothetical protein